MSFDFSLLHGVCQKCGWPVHIEDGKVVHTYLSAEVEDGRSYSGKEEHPGIERYRDEYADPVWLLAPQQMNFVGNSKEFADYLKEHDAYDDWQELMSFLRDEPFLVARILKEKGDKQ